ncbi:3'-5' exonuclease [Paucibacter sp. AS339]|uniref:3'-5' exonuclease n=1 Tax=Paucibacter hankyongi TaxID=3133434 RepID=UPI00309DE685
MTPTHRKAAPSKDETALLPPFPCLSLAQIEVPDSPARFEAAAAEIAAAAVVGFDTESKPTFHRDEQSQGPHIVQFALPDKAFIFQLHHRACLEVLVELLQTERLLKVGFGLESDHEQIQHKFGVQMGAVLDLNRIFRQEGYQSSTGARAAVGIVFQQKFHKSKKITTSNWAEPRLNERQLLYAANDAYVALRVLEALNRPHAELPITGLNRNKTKQVKASDQA